ncbi:MAG: TrmB family transcriptional regulator [Candidatus Hodarchaeales archaeon]|jgi:DNA-binding MarR family transcriptional regulator
MVSLESEKSILYEDSKSKQLVNLMITAGLSQSQAQIFLELVKKKETTASNLCRATGVKSSRIYNILSELERIGLIMVLNSSPKHYIVVPLAEGLHNLQEQLDKDFNKKKAAIKELNLRLTPLFDSTTSIPSAMAFIIKGRKNITSKIHHELLRVEKEILIRFPSPKLYFEFEPVLLDLQTAGIKINAGLCQLSVKKLREESTRMPELPLIICKRCCDCFYVMIDQNYLLSVSNWTSPNVYAIWTSDTSLINITTFFSSSNVVQ